jgi:hypothetical protein
MLKPNRSLLLPMLALLSVSVSAAEDPALLKDMTSVIALLGKPCGQVVSAKKQAENDHVVTCENGVRYRVFIDKGGRVVAQKL